MKPYINPTCNLGKLSSNGKLSPMRANTVAYIEASFAATVWGASFIATKIALAEISPITIVWLRFLMGVIILGMAVILRKQFAFPKKNEWGYFALLGFLGITFHQWLQSNGLKTSEASTTAWIVATTPVFMALLGWLILKEHLTGIKILGILLAFVGVLLVVSDGNLVSISIGKFGAPGDVLILISSVNWAVFSALSRRGLKTYSASLMIFFVMLLGWVFTSVVFIGSGNYVEFSSLSINGWLGVTFLGVFCSGLAYIAWYDALQTLSTANTGVFLYIEPLIAMIVAFFVLGEAITVASLIGGGIILFGVWLVNQN
ncbi:MAG TPA: DMT family transporter [Anaerolineales bacterium]|nr:DMT family transporter [Anaerolineales bacterium]